MCKFGAVCCRFYNNTFNDKILSAIHPLPEEFTPGQKPSFNIFIPAK